jgi:hypothetical protein
VIVRESDLPRRFPGLTKVDHKAKRRTKDLDQMEKDFKALKASAEEVLDKSE